MLNKSYTTEDHVKKIVGSLFAKYRPKVTTIQEVRDVNKISLESLINNIQNHEMKKIEDEPVKNSKSLALRSIDHYARSFHVWKSEEPILEEGSEEE